MELDNISVYMGMAVAKDMLGGDLDDLEKELSIIEKILFDSDVKKVMEVLDDLEEEFPNLYRILSILVNYDEYPLPRAGPKFKVKNKKIMKYFKVKSLSKEYKPYDFYKELKNTNKKIQFLIILLFFKDILSSSDIKYHDTICGFCGKQGFASKAPQELTQYSHVYKGDVFDFGLCVKHFFYSYLARFYPNVFASGAHHIFGDVFYRLFSIDIENFGGNYFILNNFVDFVKYVWLQNKIFKNKTAFYLVFFTYGSQNANNKIISYGKFNIWDVLYKMISESTRSVSNFKNIFINSGLIRSKKNGSDYIFAFIDFIQTGNISESLLSIFLRLFRESDNKAYDSNSFNMFRSFLRDYYSVTDGDKMDGVKNEDVVKLGYRIGLNVRNIALKEGSLEADKKYFVASSGNMELSEGEFLKGMLMIERQYNIPIYSKDLPIIARDKRKRLSFLVGFLSGLFSYDNSKEVNKNE